MRASSISSLVLIFVLFIAIPNIYQPPDCWALGFATKSPKISLTIYLVPEKEACKPSGFKTYEDESAVGCEPLEARDISTWINARVISQSVTIPPGKIVLSEWLTDYLDAYRLAPKDKPDRRRAAVFVFEWDKPQQSEVLLERVIDPNYSNLPPMKWKGILNNEKFWIHQERADALYPGYKTTWILRVGNNTWQFYFDKGSSYK